VSRFSRKRTVDDALEERVRQIATRRAKAVGQATDKRLDKVEAAVAVIRVDLDQIAHQLRSIEHRLDTAGVDAPSEAPTGPADELAKAQQEHERIRARSQLVSRFDERLRRVEEAVRKLYGGDLRGPGKVGS
jgi:hypothetical protein